MLDLLISIMEQGFIYGIAALGACISYKILNFPDLSVEGTFPLGAAVAVFFILRGVNPFAASLIAMAAGVAAGMITGVIHVKLGVSDLQSGIIMLTGLYSINLILNSRANVPIFEYDTIFNSGIAVYIPVLVRKAAVAGILFFVVKALMDWYFKTKSGFLLRAAGDNPSFVTLMAKDCGSVKILGLALANGLSALSGAIVCQYQRFYDVSMGTGIIVIAMSSVIIGISIFKRFSFMKMTTMALLGCLIFRACYAVALFSGIHTDFMRLITAVLFLAALVINNGKLSFRRKSGLAGGDKNA